ncbi:hypothetical protein V8F06_014576 [Rhypophila decipiens]
MVSQRSFLRSYALLAPSLVSAATPCSGIPKIIGDSLSGYPPAQSYCSSKYPLSPVTSTVTAPRPTVTLFNTVSTTVATTVTTATAPPVTAYVTVLATATQTVATITDTDLTTTTSTELTTSTFTTVVPLKKRSVDKRNGRPRPTHTPQASVWSSLLAQASVVVASACTCLETRPTVVVTTTPAPASVTLTAKTSLTKTNTVTVTPTVTVFVTQTTTLSVTVSTTTTSVVTEVTTSTAVATATATATGLVRGPSCDNPNSPQPGQGGCSDNCFCDLRSNGPGSLGVCDNSASCLGACTTDADCPDGQACSNGGFFSGCPGGASCVSYVQCTSTYQPSKKRDLLAIAALVERSNGGVAIDRAGKKMRQ